MKFTMGFKSPESLDETLSEESDRLRNDLYENEYDPDTRPHEDVEDKVELLRNEIESTARQWLLYGEHITIEFDTETGTATVLKPRK